jgi:copper chaperone CopZ
MVAMAASVTAVLANSFGGRLIPSRRPAAAGESGELTRVVLDVPTIHCEGCVRAVEGALQDLDGVEEAEGSAETKRVQVSYDSERASLTDIEAAVASRNFRVSQIITGDGKRK